MTVTPAQEGHDGLPAAAARAAEQLVDRLARAIGHRTAIAWVHAGAVLRWCASHNLLPGIGPAATAAGMRDALKLLADAHPALEDFTDPATVPLWDHAIPDTDAAAICDLWQRHPPTDEPHRPHGYQLGNAYQALSQEARRHRALAQTPRYVTNVLMALAHQPALDERGTADGFAMIDPACGTGHILIEALLKTGAWMPHRSFVTTGSRPIGIERALRAVHGVDLDPYAALIARLRLVVMATAMCRSIHTTLPADWPIQVAATDALLDRDEPLLARGRYHCIVANPPYITPKDARTRDAVRRAYPQVCHGKYALSLPFHQLMTELLVPGGWCAQLTANSFMKREFGKPFIENYLAQQDLRWVIDTSGAYIPGHGTPTVILAHRNQPPVGDTVATVRGNRGEPSTPVDPSRGLVWRAIEEAVHQRLAYQRLAAALERETNTPSSPAPPPPRPAASSPGVPEQLALFAEALPDSACNATRTTTSREEAA